MFKNKYMYSLMSKYTAFHQKKYSRLKKKKSGQPKLDPEESNLNSKHLIETRQQFD